MNEKTYVEYAPIALTSEIFSNSEMHYHQLVEQSIKKIKWPNAGDFSEKIMQATIMRFGEYSMEIEDVANDLKITVNAIKSHLNLEGESFVRLRIKVRHHLSIFHLIEGKSIDTIACHLGFSERKTFEQAFKRWTGLTPREFQKYYELYIHKAPSLIEPD